MRAGPYALGRIDRRQPVVREHSLNRNRVAWWYTRPESVGGDRFPDLHRRYHALLVGIGSPAVLPTWTPTGRGDVGLTMGGGQNAILTSSFSELGFVGGGFTAAMWVQTTDTTGILMSHIPNSGSYNGWEWCISQGSPTIQPGIPSLWNGSAWVSGSGTINDGGWRRLAVTNDGSITRFYVDGQPAGSASHGGPNAAGAPLLLGTRTGLSGAALVTAYDGTLADPTLWGRVLSGDEIAQEFQLSRVGYQTADPPLNWVSTRSYFVGGGGGGGATFNPAWAIGSNVVVGGAF